MKNWTLLDIDRSTATIYVLVACSKPGGYTTCYSQKLSTLSSLPIFSMLMDRDILYIGVRIVVDRGSVPEVFPLSRNAFHMCGTCLTKQLCIHITETTEYRICLGYDLLEARIGTLD